jgi:hypothetical protein
MQPNVPLTLVITQIEEISEGKYRVDNALRERLPRLTGELSNFPTIEVSATEVEEQERDLDSIPFVRSVDSKILAEGLLDSYEIYSQCPEVGVSHNFKFI